MYRDFKYEYNGHLCIVDAFLISKCSNTDVVAVIRYWPKGSPFTADDDEESGQYRSSLGVVKVVDVEFLKARPLGG